MFIVYFQAAPAVEFLIQAYPEYVAVDSLPCATVNDKVNINIAIHVPTK